MQKRKNKKINETKKEKIMLQELVEYEYVLCCYKDSIIFFHSKNLMHAFAEVITSTKQIMPDNGRE